MKKNLQAFVPHQLHDHSVCVSEDSVDIRRHHTRHMQTEAHQTRQHLRTKLQMKRLKKD